ncbi:MAG: hypothetical protein IPL79_03980 [Myxococcales bacterium]|nr:hypothetical protein [Myxococcales bacterium]
MVAQQPFDRKLLAQASVRVRYNPANPFEHRLVGDRRDTEALWMSGSVVGWILSIFAAILAFKNNKHPRLRRFLNTLAVVLGTASAVGYAVVLVEFRQGRLADGMYPLNMGVLLALGALVVWCLWNEKNKVARRGDRAPMI